MKRLALLFVPLAALWGGCATPSIAAPERAAPLAIPEGISYAEGSFEGTGGLKLHEVSWRPEGAEPHAAIIVLHGLKDHSGRYVEFADALTNAGYAVHAYDHRGHGLSEGERVWVETFDEYLDDLGTFIERVRENEPGKPLFIFGHSMGAAIATLYTIEEQPDLDGLIVASGALKPGEEVSGFLIGMASVASTLSPRAKLLEVDEELFSRDPEVVEGMRNDPLIHQENGPARTGAELLGAMERISEGASKIEVPLLVLHGAADRSTNPEGSKELVEKAGSEDKTLELYPEMLHDLLHEPERKDVMEDIISWMNERAPREASPEADGGPEADRGANRQTNGRTRTVSGTSLDE